MKYARVVAIVAVVGVLGALIAFNIAGQKTVADQVWHEGTTMGVTENPKNYFVLYTDMVCPYCNVLGQTLLENEETFEQYLAENSVLWEVRVTDYLYEGSDIEQSRKGAEGVFCAMREGRFWDYYHAALAQLYTDFQSKGKNVSKSTIDMSGFTEDYWVKIGTGIGLSDSFTSCMNNHETVAEIEADTAKAAKVTCGMPTVYYNGKEGTIDGTKGWGTVEAYFDAGLK